ncbi:MAG: hemerythrin domain-containing protein [Woeseiaceae bacterium]
MFSFFKKKKSVKNTLEVKSAYQAAPGTEIRFNPHLVNKLEDDHQELLEVFGEINIAFAASNYPLVLERLKAFKRGFLDHILVENVSLYVYMKSAFKDHNENTELVQEFRSEMDGIGKAVRAFLAKYEKVGLDKESAPTFEKEISGIGEALVARIEREEATLYPLYNSIH